MTRWFKGSESGPSWRLPTVNINIIRGLVNVIVHSDPGVVDETSSLIGCQPV